MKIKLYEMVGDDKIKRNIAPKLTAKVIKLPSKGGYSRGGISLNDVFEELIIKGWHFVFLLEENEETINEIEDLTAIRKALRKIGFWYRTNVFAGEIQLPYNPEVRTPKIKENDIFSLESLSDNKWQVTHKFGQIAIVFEEFNFKNQEIKIYKKKLTVEQISKYLKEIGDWLKHNHETLL